MNVSYGRNVKKGFLFGTMLFVALLQTYGESPLLTAAENGDVATVKALLAQGTRPNVKDKYGRSPVFVAALKGHKEIVEVLLANKADVNTKNMYGYTPLHVAASKEVAEVLLENGADANAKDKNGTTPLHSAAIGGRTEVVELLLAHGADADAKDKNSAIPLCVARSGNKEMLEALLTKSKSVWPTYVLLTESTSFGATNLAAGTKLKLVDVQGQQINVGLGEEVKSVPTRVTDIVEQVHRNCLTVEAEHSQDPTLRAAAQFQLASSEISRTTADMIAKQQKELEEKIKQRATAPQTAPAAPSNVLSQIKGKAQAQWPDDYEMQAHTTKKQVEAYQNLQAMTSVAGVPSIVLDQIKAKATTQWPDDYEMQLYTIKKQTEAYLTIH